MVPLPRGSGNLRGVGGCAGRRHRVRVDTPGGLKVCSVDGYGDGWSRRPWAVVLVSVRPSGRSEVPVWFLMCVVGTGPGSLCGGLGLFLCGRVCCPRHKAGAVPESLGGRSHVPQGSAEVHRTHPFGWLVGGCGGVGQGFCRWTNPPTRTVPGTVPERSTLRSVTFRAVPVGGMGGWS